MHDDDDYGTETKESSILHTKFRMASVDIYTRGSCAKFHVPASLGPALLQHCARGDDNSTSKESPLFAARID